MTKIIPVAAGILFVALSVSPTFAADKGNATAGKDVYMKHCNMCHGPDGAGKAAMAKMLKVEMKPLASKEVQAQSDAEMKKVIVDGKGKMKPVNGLSDADVANVIAFVRSLAKK